MKFFNLFFLFVKFLEASKPRRARIFRKACTYAYTIKKKRKHNEVLQRI